MEIFTFSPFFSLFINQGKNIVHQISVTLDDLYNGSTRKLSVQKNTVCERCEGRCCWTCSVIQPGLKADKGHWWDFLSVNKTDHCCHIVIQPLPRALCTYHRKNRLYLAVRQPFIFFGRAWESERSRTDVRDLSWLRHAGPHAPDNTRCGPAGVHGVSKLSGTRTEDQPQGPLQSMCWSKDHAAEEDSGCPHWQRWD